MEDEIFKNRRQNEKEFRRRQKQKKRRTMVYTPKLKPSNSASALIFDFVYITGLFPQVDSPGTVRTNGKLQA